ncbi:MAG TPA: hypothetical protein PK711_11340 [Bacteroidales bacterium]|nr:hypothetical protein [Bacteroidales bacterium]HRZ21082.1 hypothetical protein [Bacteroidales bacterium]
MINVLLFAIILLALAFAGIAIKMFLKKGGQFEKRCGSADVKTGERMACSCGQGDGGAECMNKRKDG